MQPSLNRISSALLCSCLLALFSGCSAPEANESANKAASQPVDGHMVAGWQEIEAAAQGTTVNWFVGGSLDAIDANIDNDIAMPLAQQYGITLNRIAGAPTADVVEKLLGEKAAGKDSDGGIDLIWINGQDFGRLKQAGLLYGPFTSLLPNNRYVNWNNSAIAYDLGVPVDGYESPWTTSQFVFEYNMAKVGAQPMANFHELAAWIAANPGRFTYPAPPDHAGSAFVRQIFYWVAGDTQSFLGPFDQAVYDKVAPQVWSYLNRLEPNLWGAGQTYPDSAAMADLLANGEIAFNMEYDANRASNYIVEGRYPPTIRTFLIGGHSVATSSYVAIPYNAANPAGAMIVANYLLSPEFQLSMAKPQPWGWTMAVDPALLPPELQAAARTQTERSVATLEPSVLAKAALPEMSAEWISAINEGWIANVLQR